MKKKVLFIMPSMFIGGAERSLLGLLDTIDYERYDVSLFLYRHEGEFFPLIPDKVHILPLIPEYSTFDVPIKGLFFSRNWKYGFARILSKAAKWLHCWISGEKPGIWMSMQYTSRFLQPLLPHIPGEYDAGIMYLGVADTLIHKVHANRKIAWNHTDYSTLGPDTEYDKILFGQIDHIVSVSSLCTSQLLKTYPQLSDKTVSIGNIASKRMILQQAEEPIPEKLDGRIILLSVGRFSYAKNFDNVPDICRRIRRMGLDIKWYLIGYGGDELLIRQKIAEAGMEKHVIILGKKENPYPYINACDLYVQPSRFEGKCVSVIEAQILGKPVVVTAFPTAGSQLENGVDGLIVPVDNKGCAKGIADLLSNRDKMILLGNNSRKRDYSASEEIKKLYDVLS